MKFSAAKLAMEDHLSVCRESWPKDWYAYECFVKATQRDELRLTRPGDEASTWEPSAEDLNSDDWHIIGMPAEQIVDDSLKSDAGQTTPVDLVSAEAEFTDKASLASEEDGLFDDSDDDPDGEEEEEEEDE